MNPMIIGFTSLFIPIIAIIFNTWQNVEKKKREKEIRELLITNHASVEEMEMILKEQQPKKNTRQSLTWGMALLGLGLGGFLAYLANINTGSTYFYMYLCIGVGAGLLAAFGIGYWLEQKKNVKEEE